MVASQEKARKGSITQEHGRKGASHRSKGERERYTGAREKGSVTQEQGRREHYTGENEKRLLGMAHGITMGMVQRAHLWFFPVHSRDPWWDSP
jgi:hypothetical protein